MKKFQKNKRKRLHESFYLSFLALLLVPVPVSDLQINEIKTFVFLHPQVLTLRYMIIGCPIELLVHVSRPSILQNSPTVGVQLDPMCSVWEVSIGERFGAHDHSIGKVAIGRMVGMVCMVAMLWLAMCSSWLFHYQLTSSQLAGTVDTSLLTLK